MAPTEDVAAPGVVPLPSAQPPDPEPKPRSSTRYLRAMLIARIYEVFPLAFPD